MFKPVLWAAPVLAGVGLVVLTAFEPHDAPLPAPESEAQPVERPRYVGAKALAPVLRGHEHRPESLDRDRSAAAETPLTEALAAVARARHERSFRTLEVFARCGQDPRVRIRALRALTDRIGSHARPILVARLHAGSEFIRVRSEAARLLGFTGLDAEGVLRDVVDSDLPIDVRCGATLGLAEVGSETAAVHALDLATDAAHPLRLAAAEALGRMSKPGAARYLSTVSVGDLPEPIRMSVCRSLSRSRMQEALAPLTQLLREDPSVAVRVAAARALGVLGLPASMAPLEAARVGTPPEVARTAQLALSRLSHGRGTR